MRTGLFWFTQDLRLHDQPALARACMSVDRLICVFNFDRAWSPNASAMRAPLGKHRQAFLAHSVAELALTLHSMGQILLVTHSNHFDALRQLIAKHKPTDVFQSAQHGFYEQAVWQNLKHRHPECRFDSIATYTLFDTETLPFPLEHMPGGFSGFRRKLENCRAFAPLRRITHLPGPPESVKQTFSKPYIFDHKQALKAPFKGGEHAGLDQLQNYFSSTHPLVYKETRNALWGWANSCKFSPWLANGCLSVRKVLSRLDQFEKEHGANDSTQWLYQELLWREYFQWFALRHGARLFRFSGVTGIKPLTTYYAERFARWQNGKTPYPLVNACMNELAQTGYLSNRGRQIVASCLINELSVDWRFGAAHFEQQLVDYDVATNWGNWQYIAGVGAANVKTRHFDLQNQTQRFDPKGDYRRQWGASENAHGSLDSVDAADWPIAGN